MEPVRSFYNPIQQDSATFLETIAESHGKHTLVEVEVAPGGGNGLHYHKTYSETFECLEGELHVQVGKKMIVLKPGDEATAEAFVFHRFFNPTDKVCRFNVTICPGSRGFEEAIQIGYGLSRDGLIGKSGTPKKLAHLAILLQLSESSLPGWQSILEKGLKWVGKRADKKGLTNQLREKYVKL